MKNIIKLVKQDIFIFILSGVIFGSIGVYASQILSKDINFKSTDSNWQVTNVEDAINDLYSNTGSNYEEYNETIQVTPTYESITLNTQDKLVKNNITINGIPSTYKNLNTSITGSAANVLLGKTFYNENGELITGTLNSSCVSGTITVPDTCTTDTGFVMFEGFNPSHFILHFTNWQNKTIFYDSTLSSTNYFAYASSSKANFQNLNLSTHFRIENNKLIGHNWSVDNISKEINYMVCK